MLYECLGGSRPAVGGYRPLGIHNEAIPPGVDTLIQAALSEDPKRRPQTPKDFDDRLNAVLRPHTTFTSTLADGSLHEIQLALNQMSPTEFAALPPGQRVLVITRLTDLATVDEEPLRRAVAELLTELVRLAHDSDEEDYKRIVDYALRYGYEKQYGEAWHGHAPTRVELNEAALICGNQAHSVITDAVLDLVGDGTLEGRPGWYFHDLRILLQDLLTNPVCDPTDATSLGRALSEVNKASH
jgi:hypothetical protein